ncbi:PQQ-dependent sugar dehydrogenase [Halalkalibacillus halophilus]|uniref:PQQ-dependent sugar dehydrogenase n=1 Tax=Halalkalibacillus halophilus TaxID=392827 RepID=UPI00041325A7|nr:sorbosone dehydrogenase family protein [Halalkalibacillus halophilus]
MYKLLSGSLLGFLLLFGCSSNDQEPPSGNDDRDSDEDQQELSLPMDGLEVVAENLDVPWSIDLADNTFYISERTGSIVKIENGEAERQDVELERELSTSPEAGLLGFTLSPDYPDSKQAFAYYTYENSEGQFNRIVILQWDEDVWREDQTLLDHIPSGTYHHGGRLKIGPDDMLYATTGDASEPEIAQDIHLLGGKILRMNLDGSIPDANPFSDSLVYSIGHRNPQGITWSSDETMYSSEHGDNANDEVNVIEAGENYGWPVIEGEEEQEGLVTPLFTSGSEDTWAPSGMSYNEGLLYVAALRGSAVLEFDLETGDYRQVISELGRIRDVRVENDYLYFVSNTTDGRGNPDDTDDRLYRIELSELE